MKIKGDEALKAPNTMLRTKNLLDSNCRLNYAPKNRESSDGSKSQEKKRMAEMIPKNHTQRVRRIFPAGRCTAREGWCEGPQAA